MITTRDLCGALTAATHVHGVERYAAPLAEFRFAPSVLANEGQAKAGSRLAPRQLRPEARPQSGPQPAPAATATTEAIRGSAPESEAPPVAAPAPTGHQVVTSEFQGRDPSIEPSTVGVSARDGAAKCLWCGTEFEPQGTGRSVKKFCSESCRRDFHTACRIWGEEAFGAGEVTVFQLRTCLGRRARRYLASEGPRAPPKPRIALPPLLGPRHPLRRMPHES